MAKRKELIVETFITINGIDYRFKDLPKEERDKYIKNMMINCSRMMSDFYRQHPEYIK